MPIEPGYKMTVEIFLIHGHVLTVRCDNFYTTTDSETGAYEEWVVVGARDVVDFPIEHLVAWRIRT